MHLTVADISLLTSQGNEVRISAKGALIVRPIGVKLSSTDRVRAWREKNKGNAGNIRNSETDETNATPETNETVKRDETHETHETFHSVSVENSPSPSLPPPLPSTPPIPH